MFHEEAAGPAPDTVGGHAMRSWPPRGYRVGFDSVGAATFTANTNRWPSRLMFPRFPPRGPGSLKSSFAGLAVNVGVVVTSADMTRNSLEFRFRPRKKISLP